MSQFKTTLLILLFSSFSITSFAKPYDSLWQEIDKLLEKQLPKSAQPLLDEVFLKAKNENQQAQLLKAINYQFKIFDLQEEEPLLTSILFANSMLETLNEPAKSILHSFIAQLYQSYYRQNRQQFFDRVSVEDSQETNIELWDLNQLRNAIYSHYSASLKESNTLKSIRTQEYEAVLEKNKDINYNLRPTIFDLLAHRALDFYLNQDAGMQTVTEPINLTHNQAWLSSIKFAVAKLPASNHPKMKALKLLQNLIGFDLSKNFTEAYIYNDLKRLSLVKEILANDSKTTASYLKALEGLQKQAFIYPVSSEITAVHAAYLIELQNQNPNDTTLLKNKGIALKMCDEAVERFPESRGAATCKNIRFELLKPFIEITTQSVELPNEGIPAFIRYKNVTTPAFRIIKINSSKLQSILNIASSEERTKQLKSLQPQHQWTINLPFEEDYSEHTNIINLPKLEKGLYVLLATSDQNFDKDENITYTSFQISNLSYIYNKDLNTNQFYVLDRNTGKAIQNVSVDIMTKNYDYKKRSYVTVSKTQLKTGKDGGFVVDKSIGLLTNQSFYIELFNGNDTLYSDNFFDVYEYKTNTTTTQKTWFFTDRSIYRPGQTIYFKGIWLKKLEKGYSVVNKKTTTVELFDSNYQKIGSAEFTTNEFGSFEGSFALPTSILNGNIYLKNESGNQYLTVEEYKRPTFEVLVNEPESQFKLGSEITIKGDAKAYAGFGLDDVTYNYRVTREISFPYWRWWFGYVPFRSESVQIAFGEGSTNEKGEFEISFKLETDEACTPKRNPMYQYHIYVDVTDKQGETQTGSLTVCAAYQAVMLSTNIESSIEKSDVKKYQIIATNLQNKVLKTKVTRKFYLLEQPKKIYRESLWEKPDRKLLSDKDLHNLFPLDNFYTDKNPLNKAKKLVYEDQITVDGNHSLFPTTITQFEQGEYYVELSSKDNFGQTVQTAETFTLFDKLERESPIESICWYNIPTDNKQPGQTIEFLLATAAKNNHVLMQIRKGDTIRHSEWVTLNNAITLNYTVQEKDRGNISFQATFVRFNRVFSINETINIPYDNKKLDIELTTLRDILAPGGTETWQISINNNQKLPVQAELLASMYDASLDHFKKHAWNFDLSQYSRSARAWSSDYGFESNSSNLLLYKDPNFAQVPPLVPPTLDVFFSNHFGLNNHYLLTKQMNLRSPMLHPEMSSVATAADGIVEEAASDESEELAVTETLTEEPTESTSTLRSNFNETAFFYPQLLSDEDGKASITFTMPDALTRWTMMLMAYNKNLDYGQKEYSFTTSKPVMIMANMPRFAYNNDTLFIAANIINTGTEPVKGFSKLEIFDALTMEQLDFVIDATEKTFTEIQPGRSISVRWKITSTNQTSLLALRFSAKTGSFTDSEQKLLPVLSNEVMLTHTMPMLIQGNTEKDFVFSSLENASSNEKTQNLVLNISTNPVWYAIQALPYLSNNNLQFADNIFYRLYANSISEYIASQIPQLMTYIEAWKNESPEAFLSQLQKDEELKTVVLKETPWVLDAKNEQEQKEKIILLFDLNKMRYEQQQSLSKIQQLQKYNGGWPWYEGMQENRFITSYILGGFGQLRQLGVIDKNYTEANKQIVNQITNKAFIFIQNKLISDYKKLDTQKKLTGFELSTAQLYELYALSFYSDNVLLPEAVESFNFFKQKIEKQWTKWTTSLQAMSAIVLYRSGMKSSAKEIMTSLRERAIFDSDLGMYWKQPSGYMWHESIIENQCLIIAAFNEVAPITNEIDLMKSWLLSQKQTNSWNTNRATAEAIYAIVLRGTNWINSSKVVDIKVGNQTIDLTNAEAGTGFVQHSWNSQQITPDIAKIKVKNPNSHTIWGGIFRQYLVSIDKVKKSTSPLSVRRELFVEKVGKTGVSLVPLTKQTLKVGDKVTVQLTVETTRNMEFVFLKDLRAATLEPIDKISGYKYRDGVGYYQSISDASMEYFFDYLPKGKYTFQYSMQVNQEGSFSNGYAIIQCLYAPEFSANTPGVRIVVK